MLRLLSPSVIHDTSVRHCFKLMTYVYCVTSSLADRTFNVNACTHRPVASRRYYNNYDTRGLLFVVAIQRSAASTNRTTNIVCGDITLQLFSVDTTVTMEVDVKWLYLLLEIVAGQSSCNYNRRKISPNLANKLKSFLREETVRMRCVRCV